MSNNTPIYHKVYKVVRLLIKLM